MKTIPPACPEPDNGRKYWRSLDQLAETPEFRQWVEREFPEGASEWSDPVSRRHFVKIMSASFLLAGFGLAGTGCRRPEQTIVPFASKPEGYTYGVPRFYATAMPGRGGAAPLLARSNDGRPTKLEPNTLVEDGRAGTDRYTQASILNLYDPDRATRFLRKGAAIQAEAALDLIAQISKQARAIGGQGMAFLLERQDSPSRRRLIELVGKELPKARWFTFEPVDTNIHRRAATQAFGQSVRPVFRYDAARVILSLDSDFMGSEEDVQINIKRFTDGRRVESSKDSMSRLYVVEPLMSITGFSADHRLRMPASTVAQVAAAVAAQVAAGSPAAKLADKLGLSAGVDAKWISECARDLAAHKGQSLVVAGHRQPAAVHLLAHLMNEALGNVGKTVTLLPAAPELGDGLAELAQALNENQVQTLVILGGNPVYSAPADFDWAKTQAKAKEVVRLGYYEDETAALSTLHIPQTHFLESWGDAETLDGTLVPIQPLIAPLFGGLTELEMLARIGGVGITNPHEIARETFSIRTKQESPGAMESAWKDYLHQGFLAGSAAKPVEAKLDAGAVVAGFEGLSVTAPGKDRIEIVFHRDYSLDDGRYNNNGWLQEMPDPVTKMVWDNVVLLSRRTASELGVRNQDVVEVQLGGRTVRGPVWVQPGQADYTAALALGYGREKSGRVGHKAGFNVYPLRDSKSPNIASGAVLKSVGATYPISCTQDHWSLEGRPIIREVNLEQYRKYPDFAKQMDAHEPPGGNKSLYPNPLDKAKEKALHQWGMSIDLNLCVGCSSCVIACQSENNVPIVGKDQVKRGREMHWLRIDRYYAGDPAKRKYVDPYKVEKDQQFEEWVDDPQALTQPMLCQHCEAAPCENVCPVNATVHDQEGLNVMVYNRCVGTRYCSNNCPYKVRRFNYFDYNKRPITELYKGPFGKRKDDEWDLLKMIKNPEVTVRMRGVMEKCTFCIQRIESAKIAQKVKAGASGDVVVPTDSFTTACAQACPAGAIVFGNLNDPESRVSRLKRMDRDYSVLDFLLTKPRLTYLARVRNPNPAMPDHREAPLHFEHYEKQMGGTLKEGGHGHVAEPAWAGHGHKAVKGAH